MCVTWMLHLVQVVLLYAFFLSVSVMLEIITIEIFRFLGAGSTLLHFRRACRIMNERLHVAIDAAFDHAMRSILAPTVIPCKWSQEKFALRLNRISRGVGPVSHSYYEIQLRLQHWITEEYGGGGIPVLDLLTFVLTKVGCWCVNLQWPWLWKKMPRCLSHLRGKVPEEPWPRVLQCLQKLKLKPEQASRLAITRDLGAPAVRATVKQILNTCVALVCHLRDYETCFSSDDDESESVDD